MTLENHAHKPRYFYDRHGVGPAGLYQERSPQGIRKRLSQLPTRERVNYRLGSDVENRTVMAAKAGKDCEPML